MVTVMSTSADVIVVGSGPAGGTTAYELARRGLDVTLLEKQKLPRYKVCAGGVTLKTLKLLDFDLSPAYESEIARGMCTFKGQSPVTIDFGEVVGWTVMRDKFDYLIVQQAQAAGARVLDEQRVRDIEYEATGALVRTRGDVFRCSMVIGADGANGPVAPSAGLLKQRSAAVALETEVEVPRDVLEARQGCVHFDFGSVPGGYGWVFPKREVLSIGVGCFWGKATRLKTSLFSFLQTLGLGIDPSQAKVRGHLVPLGGSERVLHGERVVLAGDAAGLAEPLTGEGIYYAVRSAKIAADVIYEALQGKAADLSSYTAQVNAGMVRDLRYARLLANVFYRLPRLGYRLFIKSPVVRWGVADVIYGRLSFEELFRKLLKNSPRVLWAGLR
jgi:geranylgeranyl reductase family protein